MNTADNEVVTYEDLLSFQDKALAALSRKAEAEATAKPQPIVVVAVVKPKRLTKGQRIAAKQRAADEAAIDAGLFGKHFTKSAKPTLSRERVETILVSLRLEAKRRSNWRLRRQMRCAGTTSLMQARSELGLPKSATYNEVVAALKDYIA